MKGGVLGKLLVVCLFLILAIGSGALWAEPAKDIGEPDASRLWAIGTAWSFDETEILYREFHYAEDPALDLPTRVIYRTPDGDVMAEKFIDYSASVIAPAIVQTDFRNSSVITTEHPAEQGTRLIRVGFQGHDSDRLRSRDVSHRDNLIVDAGFDPYVRENWDALTGGRNVTTSFLVPSRLDSVRISVSETESADCRAAVEPVHCFIIRPAGVLRVVSWFVDPIRIGYHPESRRLKSFAGLSNLRDNDGNPLNVLIKFEYP